ncbi:MAG: rod shape-determining protein MreC [Patescibacteria group bacterium]
MIYRRDKKIENKAEWLLIPFLIIALVFSFLFFVPSSLDRLAGKLSFLFLSLSGPESIVVKNIDAYRAAFKENSNLWAENEILKRELSDRDADLKEERLILQENDTLKEILDRKGKRQLLLAQVLTRPSRSPYDTLIVDAGVKLGVRPGSRVFANGNTLLGTVEKVYADTSLVSLFSTPRREFDARVGVNDTSIKLIGRGGGSFEGVLPKAIPVIEGDAVTAPALEHSVLGYVEKIIEDARDPFMVILVSAPVSFQSLRFVEIETGK